MAKEMFMFDGVEYASRTACAVALLDAGTFKTKSEAAKAVGISPQTVAANYGETGEKAAARRVGYNVIKLGKTGKHSVGDIAKRTNVSTSKVVSILKKNEIPLVKTEKPAKSAKVAVTEKAVRAKRVKKETPVVNEVETVSAE